ncbi:MAG: pyruvate kinase [Halobacteriovoraceae bacterium]|nr:pyruvate kinase [Halobacteriovoraceae bacterium]
MRRAKIVATLGPSSNSIEMIEKLIRNGMNVARVNMSHGSYDDHRKLIQTIRSASKKTGWEVAILLDLQGPKIRVDKLSENLTLKEGETWVIGETKLKKNYPEYENCFIPTNYEKLVNDTESGMRVLFDDGLIIAKAIQKDREVLKIEIITGGILKSNKGINLPDADVSAPSFTQKDRSDLMFGLENMVDYVALSFVRRASCIQEVKGIIHALKQRVPVVAKIEKPQAIDNIDEIIDVADVIMVARGDMGVELGNHLVPQVQKKIIGKCNDKGVPVITATQMLESMINNPTPTRAEASDVANAIWDGTDAVMLSGETAAGKYPVEAVKMMSSIIIEAERVPKERPYMRNMDLSSVNSATMVAASLIAEKTNAKRILAVTQTGNSCLKLSRFRPKTSVLGVTNEIKTVRRMCLMWGVTPFLLDEYDEDDSELEYEVIERVKKFQELKNGDKLVITRGDGQFFSRGTSNSVRVEIIKDANKEYGSNDDILSVEFSKGRILLDTNVCASCQNCVQICPHQIWQVKDNESRDTYIKKENVEKCTFDMECVRVCPSGAIEISSND